MIRNDYYILIWETKMPGLCIILSFITIAGGYCGIEAINNATNSRWGWFLTIPIIVLVIIILSIGYYLTNKGTNNAKIPKT